MVEIVGFECKILSLVSFMRVLFKLFSHFNFHFIVVAVAYRSPVRATTTTIVSGGKMNMNFNCKEREKIINFVEC